MAYRKLGRTSSQRKAILRDLTTDLLINESIVTTEARAKEIRKTVEKMITLGKCTLFISRTSRQGTQVSDPFSKTVNESIMKITS